LSMAMDDDHFVGAFEVKGEAGRSWFVGHRFSLIQKCCDSKMLRFKRAAVQKASIGRGAVRESFSYGGWAEAEILKGSQSTMVLPEPGLTDN
jgi:hypothetical protein